MASLLPSEADVIVRRITDGQLSVKSDDDAVYLVRTADGEELHLLPYQLTPEGLAQAVAEFWEPQRYSERAAADGGA